MAVIRASKVQPSRSAVERLHARAIKNGIIPLLVGARMERPKGGRRRKDRVFNNQPR